MSFEKKEVSKGEKKTMYRLLFEGGLHQYSVDGPLCITLSAIHIPTLYPGQITIHPFQRAFSDLIF